MKALDPNKAHEYICKVDRDSQVSDQTIFLVRYLKVKELAEIRDRMYAVSGVGDARKEQLLTGTAELLTLKKGLQGWKNFFAEGGEEINFEKDKIEDMLDLIPPDARGELAGHIRGESEVSEGEEKS